MIHFILTGGMGNAVGGFFSVFFFLCNAYIHAKKTNTPLFIAHADWPYNRWHDYFTTLDLKDDYFRSRLRCSHLNVPTQWKYPLEEYMTAVRELFVLRDPLKARVESIVSSLGTFTGLFVRRGDKLFEEANYIHVKDILKHIPHTETTTFFVQTDDYTVVEELQHELPNNRIVTIVPTTKRGSYHNKMFREREHRHDIQSLEEKSKEQKQIETEEMLVGLSVCLRGIECWTDDTSNVGRFLKLSKPDTVKIYPHDYPLDPSSICHPAWTVRCV
jgi:hypothetical protein